MKSIANLIFMGALMSLCGISRSCQPVYDFGYEAPVKAIVFDLPFPNDLFYQATPDSRIIVGKKDTRPPVNQANAVGDPYYEISGFEVETGKKLWQLPFAGEIIGQTENQILVYEADTATLHFINPADGQETRKLTPAPNPLLSKNGLEYGMAFNDDLYLTTKALYTSVFENATDWENRREDESFKIGITAKSLKDNKTKWFLPPIKQIVTIEYRPVILGDKVFIINPPQTIDGDQTYQLVSLKNGAELFRGNTPGRFYQFGTTLFIERTDSFVRSFDPLTGADIWKVDGNFQRAAVGVTGNQISVAAPLGEGERTITLLDKLTGKTIRQFEFPSTLNTPLRACFLTNDQQLLCNFVENSVSKQAQIGFFNYWVGFDPSAKKVLWRTDLSSHSVSSLLPFASDKLRIVNLK